jgi:SHS family sialic acid transporter-like MFS transporter
MGDAATRAKWLALAAALLGWMFDGFEMGIFPLVARPALVDVLGLTDQAALAAPTNPDETSRKEATARIDARVGPWFGGITAAFLVGAACGGWLFGWLGDRVGRVRAMIFSVLTYACFTGLCGLAQSAPQLAGLRFLSALGMGGEWALGVALVMECWPHESRPLLAGLIGAAGNAGYLLTAALTTAVSWAGAPIGDGGWRWVLAACVLPAFLTFFLRSFVPESERWRAASASGPPPRLAAIFTPELRGRSMMGAILAGVALIGTWGSVQWIPPWVLKQTGEQHQANLAQVASSVGAMAGCVFGALLAGRLGRRWTYFGLSAGSLAACAVLFWTTWPPGPFLSVWFFVAVALAAATTASFYGWLPLYLPELFPTRVRATGQGFAFNAGRLIAAVGAGFQGVLMSDRVFHGNYAQAGATISLIYIAGLFVVWLAPETRGRPMPE